MLTAAEHWSNNHIVSIFWDDNTMLSQAEDRFDLDLSHIKTVSNVFNHRSLIHKLLVSAKYDLIFFLSDGSIPSTLARYNILNFQAPFSHVAMTPWKRTRYQTVICYSEFTKKLLDPTIGIPIKIIYPPIDIKKFVSGKKENTILSVGRFNSLYGAKKHDILINVFREGVNRKQFNGWKLVIAGSMLSSDILYFEKLREKAAGLAVEFRPNCSFEELRTLYSTASIYWHATGFGETKPEHMEHFGITTVEAMASGAIPIVYAGGGQTEIVQDGITGYLWTKTEELYKKTLIAMKKSTNNRNIVHKAQINAGRFSKERFNHELDLLLENICHSSS